MPHDTPTINLAEARPESASYFDEQDFEPRYPPGLRLSLDGATLGKLGIGDDLSVGDAVVVYGRAKVVEIRQDDMKMRTNRTMVLQLTDVSVSRGESDASIGETMYPTDPSVVSPPGV